MKTVCEVNKCVGCGACVDACQKEAIVIKAEMRYYNAVIDQKKCVHCNKCHVVCQNNNPPKISEPIKWWQGWTNDKVVRIEASSGGIASELMKQFISTDGYVCSCLFENGKFEFKITNDIEEIMQFRGSKYVKSNPSLIYKRIQSLLREDKKVLFIGLPCQVAALNLYINENLQDQLYTVDLICHGTPSPLLLNNYLKEHMCAINNCKSIGFRQGNQYKVSVDERFIEKNSIIDMYSFSFLKGLNLLEQCHSCRYAGTSRVSDITIGDSWGSSLNKEELELGVSLIMCQSEKGEKFLNDSNITLKEVDIDKAIINNRQLKEPLVNELSEKFFDLLDRGRKYDRAVFGCYPQLCIRHLIKSFLKQLRIIK